MKSFPHLVEMHRKHAATGLAILSVSVDGDEPRDAARKFVMTSSATFTNYRLNGDPEIWQDRWEIGGPPVVFICNRKGQRAAKFSDADTPPTAENIDKVVEKLI